MQKLAKNRKISNDVKFSCVPQLTEYKKLR